MRFATLQRKFKLYLWAHMSSKSPSESNRHPFRGDFEAAGFTRFRDGTGDLPHVRQLKDDPEKIIREWPDPDLSIRSEYLDAEAVRALAKKTKVLFDELRDSYGINAPVAWVVGHGDYRGADKDKEPLDTVLYAVADRVHGFNLGRHRASKLPKWGRNAQAERETFVAALEQHYTGLLNYYFDKMENGGEFLADISGDHQYEYGTIAHSDVPALYLVDVEPRIREDASRPGMLTLILAVVTEVCKSEGSLGARLNGIRSLLLQRLAETAKPDEDAQTERRRQQILDDLGVRAA